MSWESLLEALNAGGDPERFWAEVRDLGTPLVEPDTRAGHRLVTFLWRGSAHAGQVHLAVARLTDRDRWESGLMQRVPGTDVWWRQQVLPATHRASYVFREFPAGTSATAADFRRRPWEGSPVPVRHDPLNPLPALPGPGGDLLSEVELDQARLRGAWKYDPHRRLTGSLRQLSVPRTGDPLWTYHPGGRVERLVLLTDGQVWFERMALTEAVDAAIAAGAMAGTALLGIGSGDRAQRVSRLGGNREYLDHLLGDVLPLGRRTLGLATEPERTVLAGQSLGGLTALLATGAHPPAVGTVIAQSPSMWWSPGTTVRPAELDAGHTPWITDELRRCPPAPGTRIRLHVGDGEHGAARHVERLHGELAARGVDSAVRIFTGGHEQLCWRAELLAELLD